MSKCLNQVLTKDKSFVKLSGLYLGTSENLLASFEQLKLVVNIASRASEACVNDIYASWVITDIISFANHFKWQRWGWQLFLCFRILFPELPEEHTARRVISESALTSYYQAQGSNRLTPAYDDENASNNNIQSEEEACDGEIGEDVHEEERWCSIMLCYFAVEFLVILWCTRLIRNTNDPNKSCCLCKMFLINVNNIYFVYM